MHSVALTEAPNRHDWRVLPTGMISYAGPQFLTAKKMAALPTEPNGPAGATTDMTFFSHANHDHAFEYVFNASKNAPLLS